MEATTKSKYILLATLVVGMLLGALGASAVWQNRITKDIPEMRTSGGFSRIMKHIISPDDDAQWATIQKVIKDASEQFSDIRKAHIGEYRAVADSMRQELSKLLSPEQQQRVDRWFARDHRKDWHARRRKEGTNPRDSLENR